MSANETIAVRVLDPAVGRDVGLADELTDLINGVYAVAERGLWRDGATRTTPTELVEQIEARQIAVAAATAASPAPSASMTSPTTSASSGC
jgi:hypothetical protein